MLLQIFLYGNSLRSYILAVVVPSQGARPTCVPTPVLGVWLMCLLRLPARIAELTWYHLQVFGGVCVV